MFFYPFLSVFFLLFDLFIVLTTKINIFPELFYYPWLISKGLLIYRDFNVQHGYFLHLLLLPFALDKSLFLMKAFYVGLQMANIYMVMQILRKTTNKIGFVFGGGIFILLNYYLSDSNLWDELIMATVYLLIYYLLIRQISLSKKKLVLIGILLGLVSFMKPSFVIFIIPLIFFYKSFFPIVPIAALWIGTFIFFAANGILTVFLDCYIFYNKYYAFTPRIWSIERSFIIYTATLFCISFLIFFFKRKYFKTNPIFFFALFSLVLFVPSFNKINLVPFGVFLSIFIGQLAGTLKKPQQYFYIIILTLYGIFIGYKSAHLYEYFKTNRLPYMENTKTARIVKKVENLHIKKNSLYVLGNQVELYYYLDSLPPVWNTIFWDVIVRYNTDAEKRIVREIKEKNITSIIIQQPFDTNYSRFKNLVRFITDSYRVIYSDEDVQILKRIQ